jgi:hypothetical protein
MDIVDTLRNSLHVVTADEQLSAADEIESLRREDTYNSAIIKKASEKIESLEQQAILRDLEIVRLREALGELLTLEYAKEQLGYLRKGIGTATKDRVWLDAESALSTPIDLSALARHEEEIVGPWKRDAERYRWLREQFWNESELCLVRYPKDAVKLGYDCPSLDRLDYAIDAAIAASKFSNEVAKD